MNSTVHILSITVKTLLSIRYIYPKTYALATKFNLRIRWHPLYRPLIRALFYD